MAQRRIGGDARAQQRRHGRELALGMAHAQHIAFVHHDLLRVAAQRVARRVGRGAVVGADHVVAVVLQPVVAVGAGLARIDDAADADQIAHLEAEHARPDGRDAPHDFVPRHARVQGAGPFRAHLMDVGMAHAAKGDVDLHVVRPGGAARDVERLQWRLPGMGTIGLDVHHDGSFVWKVDQGAVKRTRACTGPSAWASPPGCCTRPMRV